MSTNCRVCSSSTKVVGETTSYPNSRVDVHYCGDCDAKSVSVGPLSKELYDTLYFSGDVGYHHDRTMDGLSLESLISRNVAYAAIAENLPARNSRILEVGCGYGYLTNALNKLGMRTKGIDIAEGPVAYANRTYGDYFEVKDIPEIKDSSYDMIVGMEVIEHLPDPMKFMEQCHERLRPGGRLILTTPNKDFYNRKSVWVTNPPPIHLYWFGKKSMEKMARKAGFTMEVLPHYAYLAKYDTVNLLVDWLRYKNQKAARIAPTVSISSQRSYLKSIVRSMALAKPVKGVSNFLFSFRPVTRTLIVMMTKPLQ